jgi:uncharacterized damage-inducible protein DinB
MQSRSKVTRMGLMGRVVPLCLLALATAVLAQNTAPAAAAAPTPKTIGAYNKEIYQGLKAIVLRAAEVMPEEEYNFKPVDTVRTFGQILGHIADSQYYFCYTVLGEPRPAPQVEKTKTTKAELIAALKDAFAYGDKAFDGMTDASAAEVVKFMGSDAPKLGVLTTNSLHTVEHYGNLVTYLRMKGIVPPTSDPAFMQEMRKN